MYWGIAIKQCCDTFRRRARGLSHTSTCIHGGTSGKESTCQCRRCKGCGFNPWVGKIPWRRGWQPSPVFLTGKSHGQRSLVGYSPWGCKESDTIKRNTACVKAWKWKFFKVPQMILNHREDGQLLYGRTVFYWRKRFALEF